MDNCSAKNCYLLTKTLYTKTKPTIACLKIACSFCHEMSYCCEECKNLDWQFSHRFKCTARTSQPKKQLSDYEIVKKRSSYDELYHTTPQEVILGKGALGLVKLVKDLLTNRLYALKTISKKLLFQHHLVENLKRETRIQKRLNHPHILKLYQYFEDKEQVYLVLEYANKGSLGDYLRKPYMNSNSQRILSEREAFVYFIQTCLGLDYLHKNGILHRDLKPENLLLDENGNVKLCDFGWSIDETVTTRNTICGTLEYMAPEVLNSNDTNYYNEEIDLWSLGIILYEFLHGRFPDEKGLCFSKEVSKPAIELIQGLLKKDPDVRFSMNEIFQSDWVNIYEKEYDLNLEEMREKYGRIEENLSYQTGETEVTQMTTETGIGGDSSKLTKSHKSNKSFALSKKEFRNFLESSSDELKLDFSDVNKLCDYLFLVFKKGRMSRSVKSAGIKKLLDQKPKNLIEMNIQEKNEKCEHSFIDKIFEMIGCVKKTNKE